MDNPEDANIIIGTNGSMGAARCRYVPEPALLEDRGDDAICRSIDSRFITTALSGTSRDRNTSISSRKERPSTTPMKRGKRAVRYSEKSTVAATAPDGDVPAPYPVAFGRTSSRRRYTRSVVDLSCGAVVGKSRHNAAGRFGIIRDRRGNEGCSLVFVQRLGHCFEGRRSVFVSTQQQRPVEARSEAGGHRDRMPCGWSSPPGSCPVRRRRAAD